MFHTLPTIIIQLLFGGGGGWEEVVGKVDSLRLGIVAYSYTPPPNHAVSVLYSLIQSDRSEEGKAIIIIISLGMSIFIKTMTGKTIRLMVDASDTIETVKDYFEALDGMPAHSQQLIFAGKALIDEHTLSNYGICNESTIHLLFRPGYHKHLMGNFDYRYAYIYGLYIG